MGDPIEPVDGRQLVDWREHKRYQVKAGGFAMLTPQFTVLGQIIDISGGGLAFRYVASQQRSNGPSKLSILLTDHSFLLDKVSFRSIWDSAIPCNCSSGSITVRQCGVQFEELTDEQNFGLEQFVSNHTNCGTYSPARNEPEIGQRKTFMSLENTTDP